MLCFGLILHSSATLQPHLRTSFLSHAVVTPALSPTPSSRNAGPLAKALGAPAREIRRAGQSWRRRGKPSQSAVHWFSPHSPRPRAFETAGRATSGRRRGPELWQKGGKRTRGGWRLTAGRYFLIGGGLASPACGLSHLA